MSSTRTAPPPPRAAPPPPAPTPQSKAPPPAVQQQQGGGGMLSGLGSTIMEGFAFGTGSAIARQAVGAVFGGGSSSSSTPSPQQDSVPSAPTPQHIERSSTQSSLSACQVDQSAFNNCMKENNNSVSSCDFYFQALQQCQNDNNYAHSV